MPTRYYASLFVSACVRLIFSLFWGEKGKEGGGGGESWGRELGDYSVPFAVNTITTDFFKAIFMVSQQHSAILVSFGYIL